MDASILNGVRVVSMKERRDLETSEEYKKDGQAWIYGKVTKRATRSS